MLDRGSFHRTVCTGLVVAAAAGMAWQSGWTAEPATNGFAALSERARRLAVEGDDKRARFRTQLDQMPPQAMFAACRGICEAARVAGDATAIAALRTLTMMQCFQASLACRRGIIETIAMIPVPEAAGELIDLMPRLRGEAMGDVLAHLARISGENHGTDAKAWRKWFDDHRDALADPSKPDADPSATASLEPISADDSQAKYYDIPIYADRVVFVLDTSSSMQGAPLVAAKRELVSAIFALPETTLFTVIYFNSGVGPWQRELVQATEPNKRAAAAFVDRLPPEGRTATSDALQAAFTFDAEAIFFLSDGEPSDGRITDPPAIVEFVKRLNEGRARCRIMAGVNRRRGNGGGGRPPQDARGA